MLLLYHNNFPKIEKNHIFICFHCMLFWSSKILIRLFININPSQKSDLLEVRPQSDRFQVLTGSNEHTNRTVQSAGNLKRTLKGLWSLSPYTKLTSWDRLTFRRSSQPERTAKNFSENKRAKCFTCFQEAAYFFCLKNITSLSCLCCPPPGS